MREADGPRTWSAHHDRWALVPVKAFSAAKRRLGSALDDTARERLVRDMAENVVRAADPLPVAVVCGDRGVGTWARSLGALVVWEPGGGLNAAIEAGVQRLAAIGAHRVIVVHADLPDVRELARLTLHSGVTLVPDLRGDGTNAIEVPAASGFRFSYGPGSFERHRSECRRLGFEPLVIHDPALARDVDWPEDL